MTALDKASDEQLRLIVILVDVVPPSPDEAMRVLERHLQDVPVASMRDSLRDGAETYLAARCASPGMREVWRHTHLCEHGPGRALLIYGGTCAPRGSPAEGWHDMRAFLLWAADRPEVGSALGILNLGCG